MAGKEEIRVLGDVLRTSLELCKQTGTVLCPASHLDDLVSGGR